MPGRVKVSGSWKDVNAVRVKVAGAWKDVAKGYTKVSGAWKEWYSSSIPSAYELIESVTVGSGGAASVTFSNLNNYNTTYQHLQIRAVVRGDVAQAGYSLAIRVNSDSTANQTYHALIGNGSSVTGGNGTGFNTQFTGLIVGTSATSNSFATNIIDILDAYETSKFKTLRGFSGAANNQVQLVSTLWQSTSAITSLQLYGSSGNLVQGSRLSLYGIKAN